MARHNPHGGQHADETAGQGGDTLERSHPVHRTHKKPHGSQLALHRAGHFETFLNAIKYPGFQLSEAGQILWSNAAASRELDLGMTGDIFDLVLPQDQPILRELFASLDQGERQFHTRVLVESHTFVPVVLHLASRGAGRYLCVITPDALSAARLIGSAQTKVLEALSALPVESLVRTLAHSLRRWTQSDYVVFVREPAPHQALRVLSCSFSDAIKYPRLVVEYLQRRLPKGGVTSLAKACESSFGFSDSLMAPIRSADGTIWGHLLLFEVHNTAVQSVRRLMAHLVTEAAERALCHGEIQAPKKAELASSPVAAATALHNPSKPYASALARQAELRAAICTLSKEKQALLDAKEAAESSASQQHALLANISHEIRTPLNGIAGIVSLLECTDLTDTQRTYVAALARSVESMTRIVNDCFDLSGLRSENLKLKIEPTPLLPFIREICLNHRIKINEKGLRFFVSVPVFCDVLVMADRVRLRQIVDNLLTNAIKFTSGGSITLGLDIEGGQACLRVSDTGRGISDSNLENVFKRFFQEQVANDNHSAGLGIGLTISRQLVQLMDGTIAVGNNSDGPGATFEVRFPLHEQRIRLAGYSASLLEQLVFVVVTADAHLSKLALRARDEGIPVYVLAPGASWDQAILDGELVETGGTLRHVLIFDNLPASTELSMRAEFPPGTGEIRLSHNCLAAEPKPGVILEPFCWDDVFSALRLRDGLRRGAAANQNQGLQGPSEGFWMGTVGEMPELPRMATAVTPLGEVSPDASAATLPPQQLRVLLAEDDEVNQFVLKQFLNKLGFDVDIAANGCDALRLLEAEPCGHNIYIFDCMMPEMDGLELTRRIRQREHERGEPRRTLIALTADAVKGREEKCLESGFDVFLTKPIQISQLSKALRKLILPRPSDESAPTRVPWVGP